MDLTTLAAIFGWMLVVNLIIYLWSALFIIFGRDWVWRLQARVTGIPAEEWPRLSMDYLSRFKLAIIVFNLAPYLALRIVV